MSLLFDSIVCNIGTTMQTAAAQSLARLFSLSRSATLQSNLCGQNFFAFETVAHSVKRARNARFLVAPRHLSTRHAATTPTAAAVRRLGAG